jgi:hypothetical protein
LSRNKETVGPSSSSIETPGTPYLSKAGYSKGKTSDHYSAFNDASSSTQTRNQSFKTDDFISDNIFPYRNYLSGILFHRKSLDEYSTSVKRSINPLFDLTEQELKQSIRVARRKKFYAGFMAGVDATTIKFQKIEDAGYSYGLLVGYQFNKKWSIETGAFLEKKYYYSDGKYFNTSKLYLPANTRIDDASGDCKMIEVPVAVKYNLRSNKNSNWFATLGASSYIMKEEKYTYNYYYGTVGPVPHKKEYKNSSTNLFSAVSLSGGYIHRLGNFADVRIEPYLKLPVSGMGIGKLPFSSAGLQLGVTKKF